ncbi:MAG: hypothetical protein OEW94_11380 [Betaproteobacteria bacterium]|nr:hypothetical protein [Betaproteobacteria bacterium]
MIQGDVALEIAAVVAATLAALAFRPWGVLRSRELREPWVAALVMVALAWAAQSRLPAGLPVILSGACLLVLMFGWPLATVTVFLAAAGVWLGGAGPARALELAVWSGAVPATLALAIGMAVRRWLPKHLFVYILGRAFAGTALACALAAALHVAWLQRAAPGSELPLLTAGWLIAWGEAFLTGGLAAIFVAFRPQWLLTYSDQRYLPPRA